MNISKFTQKSVQAVQDLEKVAYEYGNQEIEQGHLLSRRQPLTFLQVLLRTLYRMVLVLHASSITWQLPVRQVPQMSTMTFGS